MIEMLRNAVQEFPNNYDLLYCLARALCFAKEPYVFFNEEERRKNLHESISICSHLLGDCTDDGLRFRSIQVLAYAYKSIGEFVYAKKERPRVCRVLDCQPGDLMEYVGEGGVTVDFVSSWKGQPYRIIKNSLPAFAPHQL